MTPDEVDRAATLLRRLGRSREQLATEKEAGVSADSFLISVVQERRVPEASIQKLAAYARALLVDYHSTEIERMTKELHALGVEIDVKTDHCR